MVMIVYRMSFLLGLLLQPLSLGVSGCQKLICRFPFMMRIEL